MKTKARYLIAGMLFLVGLLSLLFALTSSEDSTKVNISIQDEVDVTSNEATDGLSEADQWMIRYIKPPADVDSKKVYTFECELLSQKPEELTTLCADFGELVYKIRWSKWAATGAEGSGIYSVNDCTPDCADGKRHDVPVKVYLSDVTTDGKNYFLNTLTFTPFDGYIEPGSYVTKNGLQFAGSATIDGKEVATITWDLASFYREVPDMRTKLPS